MQIKQLSRHVADLIAAGEVVERPASAVKELVENSIDAGARHITVEIKRGGLELLRVTDDGAGIAKDELALAFLRHATSKIESAEDLESVSTMGFRGEALASIAAVSKVRVFSKCREAENGAVFEICGSNAGVLKEAGCPDGTSVFASEIFFNTPARHKFLKRDATEAGYCQAVVRRAALANPDISFRMLRDGEEVLHTPGNGSARDAMYAALGGVFAAGMVSASCELKGVRVWGFVSKPENSQGNRTRQEFFVGRRPVRSRLLASALEEAYRGAIMQSRFPACVLSVMPPPRTVDINVHPSKLEVKFADERAVFDAVYLAVKSAIDKSEATQIVQSKVRPEFWQQSVQTAIPREVGFLPQSSPMYSPPYDASPVSAQEPQDAPFMPLPIPDYPQEHSFVKTQQSGLTDDAAYLGAPALPKWRVIGELFSTYIVAEDENEVLFIDKHAAHERIIYEDLIARQGQPLSQALIEPAVFSPTAQERDALEANRELIAALGFEVEDFGGGSLIIRAVPSDILASQACETLQEIAEALRQSRRRGLLERREEALRLVACKAAIKAGAVTTYSEIYALVQRVLEDIRHCPHGRPVVSALARSELERRMGRSL